MKRTKPLYAALAVGAVLTVAACGGSGNDDSNDPGNNPSGYETANPADAKDDTATGPAPDIEGAATGGNITVYLPGDPGPSSLDPTEGWSVTGNSITQDLVSRSLTTYRKDAKTGQMVLVPDLATDLGTPNDDFTEWTFTLKDGLKWSDGTPITAEQVAWGIQRSYDSEKFPGGPGTQYTTQYFDQGGDYKGPYTDPKGKFSAVTVKGNDITIKMKTSFPDMDYWGAFEAMGPVPLGKASNPPKYGLQPLASGPYMVKSFKPNQELVLEKNPNWDPASDPARHQYVDGWTFSSTPMPSRPIS